MKQVKPFLFLGFLAVFIFSSLTVINAQTETETPITASQTKAPGRADTLISITKKPQQGTPSGKPSKQDIVKNIALHAKDMLTAANSAISRLDNIWTRVLSRIEKFKAAGKDVSSLASLIQQVEVKKKTATESIASASSSLTQIETSPSPKTAVKAFINLFKNVKTVLKDYHQAILAVIINLKGMSAQTGGGPTATGAATTAPNTGPTATGSQAPTPTPTGAAVTVTVGPT